jgi:hypothetical protein
MELKVGILLPSPFWIQRVSRTRRRILKACAEILVWAPLTLQPQT